MVLKFTKIFEYKIKLRIKNAIFFKSKLSLNRGKDIIELN